MFYEGVKKSDFGSRSHVIKIYTAELFLVHLKNIIMKVLFGEDPDQ